MSARVLERNREGREVLWQCAECGQPFTLGWGDMCNACIADERRHKETIKALREGPSAVDGQQGEPRKLPVEAGSIPVPLSNWQPIEAAPKDGKEILVRFPRMMNVVILASWNKIHGYWQSKGKPEFFHEGDMWCAIPAWEVKQ